MGEISDDFYSCCRCKYIGNYAIEETKEAFKERRGRMPGEDESRADTCPRCGADEESGFGFAYSDSMLREEHDLCCPMCGGGDAYI